MRTRESIFGVSMLAYACGFAQWAAAQDVSKSCQTSGWEMSREIAAFRGSVPSVAAGTTAKDARALTAGVLAELTLEPQGGIQFAAPPERPAKVPMPLAGLAQFKVPTTGHYRVTVDVPLWLDAVSASAIIPSGTFNGWHECPLFRKTVEYPLQAGQVVVLQFSGAASAVVKVLIEAVPAAS
jgi:hypothetical protein